MSTPSECARVACSNAGTSRCTGCKGAEPETVYCSVECQTRDWKMFHKTFCGKKAYTFELTLIGSSDPVISRTFDVPSWFTFRQMHYTLQYTMGPWMQTHLHDFHFEKMTPAEEKNRNLLSPRKPLLKISSKGDLEVDTFPKQDETKIKLSDVYEPTGRLRDVVAPGGELATLIYLYDFGDNWEHKLVFKGSKLARDARPLFTAVYGCAPVEDAGGLYGWEEVKAAFRASHPTPEQRERMQWAKDASGRGASYSPLAEPDIIPMNYEGRWENHLKGFMQGYGERWRP